MPVPHDQWVGRLSALADAASGGVAGEVERSERGVEPCETDVDPERDREILGAAVEAGDGVEVEGDAVAGEGREPGNVLGLGGGVTDEK